jgi:hypothetical protein
MNFFLPPINYQEEFDSHNIIINLQPFMFTNNNIMTFMQYKTEKKEKVKVLHIPTPLQNLKSNKEELDIFFPFDKDSLFWCFYIIKFGIEQYHLLPNRNFITEKKIKIEYVERSRNEKQLLKQKEYKFSTITDFENMLANENIIHVNTFFSLCVLEKVNVILIKKNNYFELFMNDTNIIYIIVFNSQKSKYGVKISNIEWYTTNIKLNYNKVDKLCNI